MYVPIVTQTTREASPRARELARQVEQVVQDFQRSYPDTRPADVQQALQIASGTSGEPTARHKVLALSLAGGVAALVGVYVMAGGGLGEVTGGSIGPMFWLVAGLIIVLALAFAARRT